MTFIRYPSYQIPSSHQLQRLSQLELYEYRFAEGSGLAADSDKHVGLLAQQVRDVLPHAVRETVRGGGGIYIEEPFFGNVIIKL